jgi:hypothetical protein
VIPIIYLCGLCYTFGLLILSGMDDEWEDDALSMMEQVVVSLIAAIVWPLYWALLMYQTFRGK